MVTLFALICPTLPMWADTWTKLAGQEGYLEWRAVAEDESEELVRASITDVWDGGLEINVTVPSVSALPLYDPDGNEYIQLRSPGCGATAQQVGFPEMPFKGFFVEIPYGVVVSVDIQDKKSTLLGTGLKVYPLQPPQPDSGKAENNSFQVDQNAYATNSFFPSDCVVLDEPGIIRGRRVVFVQVFPFQYNPATTELRAFSSLLFTLHFKGSADPSEQVRKQKLATDVSESLAKELILNYEPITPSRSKSEPELSTGSAADYLIIVADTLYDETLPLAEWKHKKGFITRIVTMSSVGSTAADVKNYIQNAYDNWTPAPSYVLLVGDSEDVPPDYFSGTLACTTDNPYACVDGTDYYPDLTLGRLPVHTETECTNVVDKILYYDRTPDLGSWYDKFLSAGYFQDYDDDNGVADRWFMETTMTIYDFLVNEEGWSSYTALCTSYWPLHYSTWHFRSSSYPHRQDLNLIRWGTSPYPDPVPQWIVDLWTSASDSTQDVTEAINAGVSIVQHRDHGAETLWGDPPYGISNINSLSNGIKTPVVFSTNCLTGSFHWTGGDCFCEAFLKKSPGGCVGIVGATRLSYSGYNDLLVHGVYTSFWPSYDPTYIDTTYPHSWRPAQALNFGKYYMLTYEGTGDYTAGEFYMFHWFGDPEMPLRTETPQSLAVTYPSAVVAGQPINITIDVTRGGLPLENALVCISHPTADDHWSGLTDAVGSITFSGITLTQPGENYDIVVSERNSVPYEGIIYAGLSDCGIINLDREAYSCDDTITIFVADLGLQGSGIQDVNVTTSGGDFETVTLTEDPNNLGLFEEWILTCTGDPNVEDGRLQVAHGEIITAMYEDPNYCGPENPETVQDTATADCQSPTISNVQIVNVGFDSATITFETDEITTGRVRYGLLCGGPNTIVEDLIFATAHSIDLTGLSTSTPYFFVVDASDSVNNFASDPNDSSCYTFTTLDLPDDYFAELFDAADNDLDNISITLIPDGMVNYYTTCVESTSVLPTDPSGGTPLPLSDDDYEPVPLSGGATVSLYGESYGDGEVSAGSNGYLTFGAGDTDYTESLADHFNLPRISALFDDLNPSAGGTIGYKQLGDRLAVTWENVPEYSTSNANTFQIEMFFNGQIRISWLAIEATDGLAGLSDGLGIPSNFTESDLSAYGVCAPTPPVAENANVSVCSEEPEIITLEATDDGLPDPPGALTYIIWTLPTHGSLVDPASGPISDPNTPLVGYGNQVEYTSDGGYTGPDEFTFKANDGGFWPTGGDSNEATVSIDVLSPPAPSDPDPNDGAIDVPTDPNLTWNGSSLPDATGSLTTTFAGGNGQNGNMFDLTAKETITITGWEGNINVSGGPATIEV
ncbi:MAG: C25 family cysteine peptidase, partial [Planctomycetota bacterium]